MKKSALYLLIFVMVFIPLSAELWSSSSPIMMKYQGKFFFPAFVSYHAQELGIDDQIILTKESFQKIDSEWQIWPLYPWGPKTIDKELKIFPAKPSARHWMGTDDMGRDILATVLYGLRISYLYSFVICFFTLIIGFFIGGLFGFYGGLADLISQRAVEILSLVPTFFLILMALSMFDSNLLLLIGINSLLGWMGISQMMRVETLKVRKLNFVEAATALGSSRLKIFIRHIVPNALTPVLTTLPFLFMGHIVGLSVLDYLGLGISTQFPSIGGLIARGQAQLNSAWWIIFYPSVVLTLLLMGWVIIGEKVRQRV